MTAILVMLMSLGSVSAGSEMASRGAQAPPDATRRLASLCEEMRGTFREAVAAETISRGEYEHLMRRCKRWEDKQDK